MIEGIDELTVVIPTKNGKYLAKFIKSMKWLFAIAKVIVIDSGGGTQLKKFAYIYINKDLSLVEARKVGYKSVKTKYILNLDDDTIIPRKFISDGLKILCNNSADAVTIDYKYSQGHYVFGASIWKTETLIELYNFPAVITKTVKVEKERWVTLSNSPCCECTFMWGRLIDTGRCLIPLQYKATHLKEDINIDNMD